MENCLRYQGYAPFLLMFEISTKITRLTPLTIKLDSRLYPRHWCKQFDFNVLDIPKVNAFIAKIDL